jgi:hypothetical protein
MLEFFKGKVVCPRCDGNGLVYRAEVKNMKIVLYICDECEATWNKTEDIGVQNFVDLSTFLERHGFTYRESEIINLGYDWCKE